MTAIDPTTMIDPSDHAREEPAVRSRLDDIWSAAAARDFERLESFHLYGEGFTSFKDGAPRNGADGTAAGERAMFTALTGPAVDMRDLRVETYGEVAIATFNGHFTATLHEEPVAMDQQVTIVFVRRDADWRIVHEHFSPLLPTN